jgi:hypothetical protein
MDKITLAKKLKAGLTPKCLDATKTLTAVIKAQMKGRKGIVVWYPHESMLMHDLNKILKTKFTTEDNKIIIIPCSTNIEIKELKTKLSEAQIEFEVY